MGRYSQWDTVHYVKPSRNDQYPMVNLVLAAGVAESSQVSESTWKTVLAHNFQKYDMHSDFCCFKLQHKLNVFYVWSKWEAHCEPYIFQDSWLHKATWNNQKETKYYLVITSSILTNAEHFQTAVTTFHDHVRNMSFTIWHLIFLTLQLL